MHALVQGLFELMILVLLSWLNRVCRPLVLRDVACGYRIVRDVIAMLPFGSQKPGAIVR